MESITALFVLAAMVTSFLGKERLALSFFALSLLLILLLLRLHITESLPLSF